ncbi:MAG: class I SAM-dependent methyltransferase [Rhodocyclales bacterium]|nr:class I SAM-dependent methyltransferase [Rhodocyclales bacterium]
MGRADVSSVVGNPVILGAIKKWLPWEAKVVAKMALSRLPMGYEWWSRVGLFRHGNMDAYSYAWGVLQKHAAAVRGVKDWRGLELGPGDGLLSSLLAPAALSSGLVLVDAGDYAHKNIERYRAQVQEFVEENPEAELPDYSGAKDVPTLLAKAKSQYLCDGLGSLRLLEDESFDLIFSHAVFEHIRRAEFEEMMQQCYRLVKPNGVMSHVIDFKDHLGGGLNNMRFASELWERSWFAARSGFYTNRLRLSEIVGICERVGFRVEVQSTSRWAEPPIGRMLLASEFRCLSDDDLCVSGAHLIMRRQ